MAIALDEQGLRDQVFELRRQNPPVSWPKIGEQLGISRSKAQRLFNRRAQPSSSSSTSTTPAAPGPSTPSYEQLLDPDVRERRRQLELRRIADAEQDLELRGLERQKRIALLQNAGGGDGATTMLLMQMVDRLERRIDERGSQAPAHTPTLFDQLNNVAKLQETISKFTPPTPPNAALDLEWRTRMAALDREDKRIAEQHEKELAVRQAAVDSENRRNDMLARFIEGFGPTLSKVAEKYVEDHMRPQPQQQTALAIVPPAGAAAMQNRQEIQGECPVCRTLIGKSTPDAEKCPGCGSWLVLDTMGQIALADDSGAAPQVAQASGAPAGYVEPQRFAS